MALERIRDVARNLVRDYRDTKEATTYIHPDTPPVLWFGRLETARVATLGINPSKAEYFSKDDDLLRGQDRRLASWPDIVAEHPTSIDAELDAVITSCSQYFETKPYQWFRPLDQVLTGSLGKSFNDGSACHLDLFPWATTRYWGQLNSNEGKAFVDAGRHFLETVLIEKKFDCLLINGRTVFNTIKRQFDNSMKEGPIVDDLELAQKITFFSGHVLGTPCIAWSANIQNYRGTREPLIATLVKTVKQLRGN